MKKKVRIAVITVAIIAVLIACYAWYYMRPQPLLDCMQGTDPANGGTVVLYEQNQDPVTFTVEGSDQVADLWKAMENTQVSFRFGRGMVSAPVDGAYYEVALTASQADGTQTGSYSFGCTSDGKLIIVGSSYSVVGESDLTGQLQALFDQADG